MSYELLGCGLSGPWDDVQVYLAGGRMLPVAPVRKWLTRLSTYGLFLQLGLKPYQIEALYENDNDLTAVFEQMHQAQLAAQGAALQTGAAIGAGAGGTVGGVAASLIGGTAGAGVGFVISTAASLMASTISRSKDCIEGVTSQWFGMHRDALREKVRAMQPYLNDALEVARDGQLHDQGGVSAADPVPTDPAKLVRYNMVRWVYRWLYNSQDTASEPELLTLYGKLACMSNAILASAMEGKRRELGALFYCSLIGMLEAYWKLVGFIGIGGIKGEWKRVCPDGPKVCHEVIDVAAHKSDIVCAETPFCTSWARKKPPLDVYMPITWRADRAGVAPQWATILDKRHVEYFIEFILMPLSMATQAQQDAHWSWRAHVKPPIWVKGTGGGSGKWVAAGTGYRPKAWHAAVAGGAVAALAAWLISRKGR